MGLLQLAAGHVHARLHVDRVSSWSLALARSDRNPTAVSPDMPPAEIADSDSDGEGQGSCLPPWWPNQAATGIDAQTRSSDRASHTTASTDPAFFQSIFNEQNDAANRRTQGARGSSSRQGGSALSDTLNPAGQDRSTTTQDKDMDDVAQVTTPQKDGAKDGPATKTPGSSGIWDIPSSPESQPKSQASRKRKGTTVKIARSLRRNPEKAGYQSEDEAQEACGGDDGGASKREIKKRRLESWEGPQGGLDGIGSTTTPLNGGAGSTRFSDPSLGDGTESAALVPTLPLNSDSSLLIAPKPLSASQKLEYQSVLSAQISSPPTRHLELKGPKTAFSGSATNVNTPRSNLLSSHDAGLTTTGKMRRSRSPRRQPISSPDEIAAVDGGNGGSSTGKPRLRRTCAKDMMPDAGVVDGGDQERQAESVPYEGRTGEDEDADLGAREKAASAPKRRGRPRKTAASEGNKVASPAAPASADMASTAKPNKKRGRPKKVADAEEAPPCDDKATEPGARGGETAGERGTLDAPSERPTCDVSGRGAAADAAAPAPVDGGQGGEDGDGTGKGKGSGRPGVAAKPGVASKQPAYRVGLSKRWRIAPLLKSLRKS